jgi:alkylation response protein AidB-like acyl-CoA dehydrogenase
MATKLRAARSAGLLRGGAEDNHEPYAMEAAMAKQYSSEICLEVTNDALQILAASGT